MVGAVTSFPKVSERFRTQFAPSRAAASLLLGATRRAAGLARELGDAPGVGAKTRLRRGTQTPLANLYVNFGSPRKLDVKLPRYDNSLLRSWD
jgi:hypothetical protein